MTLVKLPKLIPFNKNNKWGFCDKNKQLVIDTIYDGVSLFENGLSIVWQGLLYQDRIVGVINELGEVVVPLKYGEISPFSEGFARVRKPKQHQYGFINTQGNVVIPCKYTSASHFSEGLVWIMKGNQEEVFLDQEKKSILSLNKVIDFAASQSFSQGWTVVGYSGPGRDLYQYKNQEGVSLNQCFYKHAVNFKDDLALVVDKKEGTHFIDLNGHKVLDCQQYSHVSEFQDGLALVQQKNLFGFINRRGEEVIPCLLNHWIRDFSEALAKMKQNELFGFIDKKLNQIVPTIYHRAANFSEGLALVSQSEKYGFVNKKGELQIPMIYDDARSFEKGLAWVRRGEFRFYIDQEGVEYVEG